MTHPLEGARHKLEWAHLHFEVLEAEIAASDRAESIWPSYKEGISVTDVTLDAWLPSQVSR